jgi:hypothetical protein
MYRPIKIRLTKATIRHYIYHIFKDAQRKDSKLRFLPNNHEENIPVPSDLMFK